jgi:hypothetical protein
MRAIVALTAIAAVLCGCSKKSGGSAEVATEEPAAKPTAAQAQPNPTMDAGLSDISKKMQAQEYEAAVGSLLSLRMMQAQASEKDQAAFARQFDKTMDALSQRAAQGDQRAAQAQQMLKHTIISH